MNDATSNLMQVGRDCLKAYTGLASPEHLCSMAEFLFSASDILSSAEGDEFEGGTGGARWATIERYMPYVCRSIRADGWLSRGAAYASGRDGQATADQAMVDMWDKKQKFRPEEKDFNLAAAVIAFCEEHFEGCDVAAISDYENSLRVAMASGIVHPKFTGIIASAVQFYNKDLERRARAATWKKSEYVGTPGERRIFENLKVVGARTWESQFGTTYFYTFQTQDETNSCIVWKASSDQEFSVGQFVNLKATVKEHAVYTPKQNPEHAYKQTVINRASLCCRAKVVSYDAATQEEEDRKVVVDPGQDWNQPGGFRAPKYGTKKVTYHHYHFEAVDGRKLVLISKSKKKGLVNGSEHVVEYVSDAKFWGPTNAERPCSLA